VNPASYNETRASFSGVNWLRFETDDLPPHSAKVDLLGWEESFIMLTIQHLIYDVDKLEMIWKESVLG
jgi:hypothetical protein